MRRPALVHAQLRGRSSGSRQRKGCAENDVGKRRDRRRVLEWLQVESRTGMQHHIGTGQPFTPPLSPSTAFIFLIPSSFPARPASFPPFPFGGFGASLGSVVPRGSKARARTDACLVLLVRAKVGKFGSSAWGSGFITRFLGLAKGSLFCLSFSRLLSDRLVPARKRLTVERRRRSLDSGLQEARRGHRARHLHRSPRRSPRTASRSCP